jgi:hypothetical protein
LFAESVYKLVRKEGLRMLAQGIVPDPEVFGKELDEAATFG